MAVMQWGMWHLGKELHFLLETLYSGFKKVHPSLDPWLPKQHTELLLGYKASFTD